MKTDPNPSTEDILRFLENVSDKEILTMYQEAGLNAAGIAQEVRRGLLDALPRPARKRRFVAP